MLFLENSLTCANINLLQNCRKNVIFSIVIFKVQAGTDCPYQTVNVTSMYSSFCNFLYKSLNGIIHNLILSKRPLPLLHSGRQYEALSLTQNEDILNFWKENQQSFPLLSKLTCQVSFINCL